MTALNQRDALRRQITLVPGFARLQALASGSLDDDLLTAVLDGADAFAAAELAPRNREADRDGCRVADGRVFAGPALHAAWRAYRDGGWTAMGLPAAIAGQDMPLVLLTACDEIFNRAFPAFMMMPTATRAGAALLHRHADAALRDQWVPRLASGEWTATICISEPDAGSDVGRVRTSARRDAAGRWRVTGEKCWISFGDHDLAARIGHCMLVRTGPQPGVRGLSLFLTPNVRDDGTPNGVFVRRIEEKLGLHGSPTCALGFEDADAHLIGEEGRGLQQLFTMMILMRLSCAPQGVGVAAGAAETAFGYAQDRRQGGAADAPPPPIARHADVQRQILSMSSRVIMARGVSLAAATAMDLAERESDEADRRRWGRVAEWLLPIAKDLGGRTAFAVASDAIQVLGGAGYTREWPVEQALRDSRVFAVFEGTTGMQAIDLLHRRLWRDRGEGLSAFLALARADAAGETDAARALGRCLDQLESVSGALDGWRDDPGAGEAGAIHYLDLCTIAATAWIAARIADGAGDDGVGGALKAVASFYLAELPARAALEATLAGIGKARLGGFDALLAA